MSMKRKLAPFAPIRRDGNVVATFYVGQVALQRCRAAVPIGIEPEIFAGL